MKTHAQNPTPKITGENSRIHSRLSQPAAFAALLAMMAVLAAAVGLSSCAGYTTNAASNASQASSAAGILSASTSAVDFGSVPVGSSTSQTVALSDTGTAPLTISGLTVSGAGFSLLNNGFSGTIAAGQSVNVQVQFSPQSAGSMSGTVTVATDASSANAPSDASSGMTADASSKNSNFKISLHGNATQAGISMSPSSVSFSNVAVGQASTQSIALTNNGTAPLQIKGATVTGAGFSISGLAIPLTISAGQGTSFTVRYAPTSAGSANGSISFSDNAPASPQIFGLTGGTSANGTLSANPASYNFNGVAVGSSSKETITLTNSGASTVTINQVSASGTGFSASGLTAGQTIAAGGQTSFAASFAPSAAGNASGTITVSTNASNPTLSIGLSGTGMQALGSANPASVAFGSVVVGNTNSGVITLKNNGNMTLSFSQISVSGSGFSISGLTTSSTIPAGGSLNFNAVYTPASATSSSGSIALATNGSPSQISIGLSGTGTAAAQSLSLSSSGLNFGNVQVGGSNSLTATVTNSGNANVSISGVTVTGAGYTTSGLTSGMTLTPNQTVTLTIGFAPTALGNDPGTVSIASSAAGSPATISLAGESHKVLLSWTASTSSGVAGYYVYRGTQSGQYAKIDASAPASGTQFTDATVAAGTTYYYLVTAVDGSGTESSYSSAATVNVP